MHRLEHGADVVVGRDPGHAKQAVTVGRRLALFQRPLILEEGLRLHEKQRKGGHTDIRHRIDPFAFPLIREGAAQVFQTGQKVFDNQHPNLESEPTVSENQKITARQNKHPASQSHLESLELGTVKNPS